MAGKIGPALAMGNTVVVKPAPQDPLAIIELVRDPRGGRVPAGRRQRRHRLGARARRRRSSPRPHVDMVSFTGSTPGRREHRRGRPAETMKRLLLELGGKGACIVFDDADLKTAIGAIGQRVGASTPARSAPRRPG